MIAHRMNYDGLLECPFCDGDGAYREIAETDFVFCGSCWCRTDDFKSIDMAVNSWNTRNGKLYTVESMRRADEEGDME